MKRNSQPNQPTTVDDLARQRAELVRAQTEAHARLDSADPLDWRSSSTAASDLQAIGSAIQAIDSRLAVARQALAQATDVDREAAQATRRQAAVKDARTATVATVDVLRHLDAGVFAELDKAIAELGACGGLPAPSVTMALVLLRRQVTATLAGLADLDPVLMGLPPHPTAAEQALTEARRAVETATERLESLRKEAKRPRFAGEPSGDFRNVITTQAHGLFGARSRLLRLTEPNLDDEEVFQRAINGLGNELDDYIGRHYEAQRQRAAKETRENRANQGMEVLT